MNTYDFSYTLPGEDGLVLYLVDARKLTGIKKLAQSYIKLLLTRKGTNLENPEYGTDLVDIAGSTTDRDGFLVRSRVIAAINHATKWYKGMQLNNPADREEMLDGVKVMDVRYDIQSGNVMVKLYLTNRRQRGIVTGITI